MTCHRDEQKPQIKPCQGQGFRHDPAQSSPPGSGDDAAMLHCISKLCVSTPPQVSCCLANPTQGIGPEKPGDRACMHRQTETLLLLLLQQPSKKSQQYVYQFPPLSIKGNSIVGMIYYHIPDLKDKWCPPLACASAYHSGIALSMNISSGSCTN